MITGVCLKHGFRRAKQRNKEFNRLEREMDNLVNQILLQESIGDGPALDRLVASKKVIEQELHRLID